MNKVQIAGAGIGGLAAALACARAGHQVGLCERTLDASEVGAGVQLGPNVVEVLFSWGLEATLRQVAFFPEQLQVRSAATGGLLSSLLLGEAFVQRYGAPYLTIHRADLHGILLQAVKATGRVDLQFGSAITSFTQNDLGVSAEFSNDLQTQSDLLLGADGGWSTVRKLLLNDGTPQPTGHLAYRAMVPQSDLPAHLRCDQVTAWLGPKLHVVQYPVRGGQWLNVVAIVHGQVQGDMSHWDHSANAADLKRSMALACAPLRELIGAIAFWRLWPLSIRTPMRGAHEHALGRVALLGDAAHPMVPYLAQGAGMAIEDAAALAWVLAEPPSGKNPFGDVPAQLQRYAQVRWQRNALVQARAIKNGQIFHATGLMRWGRDAALRLLGENLLDMPWLYGGKAHP
ncbi:MAG: FAD-dependent monooxygenase [Rhodoferax sp.]|uniref:FAD-dependent monooxygenase n=1 Tax=Rhodoferax sp. TaxID=50421 RepID=UPI002628AECE|nr:FAD-dependent monooxygenase [Rhodoferax sp.]MDD2883036.1 FAD-dependent monooxygenase [Rhodoferax sp.]